MLFEMIPAYLEFFGFGTATPDELRAVATGLLLTPATRRHGRFAMLHRTNRTARCPDLAGLLNFACDPANFEAAMALQVSSARTTAMRKPKAPEANRARILAAAIAEFASRGFKGASMDAIAARTSTTRALINYYFGSKEKLYLAVLERVYAEIRDAERDLELDHLPPVDAIRRIVEFTYNYYVEHEYFVRLVVAENQAKGRHMKRSRRCARSTAPSSTCSARVIARGQADGSVPRTTSIRSTSTWRSRPSGCSTSPISTPSAPSSSGTMGAKGDVSQPPPDGGRHDPELARARVSSLARQLHSSSRRKSWNSRSTVVPLLKAGAALAASQVIPAWAQDKPTLRFAAVFSDKDIRADMIRMLAKDVEADFKIEPFYGGTLFKQGTELVALQRDNLEMGNIAPQDISKQMPAWSVLTSAYIFRDANHVLAFFASDLGAQMKKQAEDQLKIKILGPTFFGTRQVGPEAEEEDQHARRHGRHQAADARRATRGSSSAARSAPIRRRWPTPRPTPALQTGAIDGQDNPLPNVQNMKFYEVMSQIVLTSHLVAFDVLCDEPEDLERDGARPSRRASRPRSTRRSPGARQEHLKREAELADGFKKQGLDVYTPDLNAFRTYAQKIYLASDEAKAWAPGILDKITAVK